MHLAVPALTITRAAGFYHLATADDHPRCSGWCLGVVRWDGWGGCWLLGCGLMPIKVLADIEISVCVCAEKPRPGWGDPAFLKGFFNKGGCNYKGVMWAVFEGGRWRARWTPGAC